MADHSIELHATVVMQENLQPEPETLPKPKPRPDCCEALAKTQCVWWEDVAHVGASEPHHRIGWTGVANVSIPSRMYWLYNPTHCPMCGKPLPEKPQ